MELEEFVIIEDSGGGHRNLIVPRGITHLDDTSETSESLGVLIADSDPQTTPGDTDQIAISVSSVLKRLSWANLKTGLYGIFAHLAGVAGGQTLTGGTGASQNLGLLSTSNATKGSILIGSASAYNHQNERLGIGTLSPATRVHAISTGTQLRLGYDAAKYCEITVSSVGKTDFVSTGRKWSFSGPTSEEATATSGIGSFPIAFALTEGGVNGLEIRQSASSQNLSIGIGSGASITYGSGNTNVGFYAGYRITSGTYNLNLGYNSGINIDGGSYNQNIGYNSGYNITSGNYNINIGYDAGYNGTTCSNNINIGPYSGRAITTGWPNTNIGLEAGASITTGAYNLNFGYQAGYTGTTYNYTINIGREAGKAITTGSSNLNIGDRAGYRLTTGTYNINIGPSSGNTDINSSFVTTNSYCTYIGASTKASANGITGETVIGYGAEGSGANTITLGSIYTNTATKLTGDILLDKTVTAAGTNGAQTINKTSGSVNFAAAATSLVVTNSRVSTTSVIICTVATNDTTLKTVSVVAAAGSFTIYANAAATAATRVNFVVTN